MLKYGSTDISKIYYGSNPIKKIYAGTELIWTDKPSYDAELKWIETDGEASYINTGITSSADFSLEIDCQLMGIHNTQSRPNCTLFGARGYYGFTNGFRFSYMYLNASEKNIMWFRVPSTSNSEGPTNDYGRHVVRGSATTISIDNVSVPVTSEVTTETPYLGEDFCIGRDGNIDVVEDQRLKTYANARFYSIKLYKNNVLVFDGIPVRIGTEGCLYDKVSKTILHNAGSGTIIPGPPVETPYDYEVEYIQRDCSTSWTEDGQGITGGFDISQYIPQDQTMQNASKCSITWSFTPNATPQIYGLVYWVNFLYSFSMWKTSSRTVYSFANGTDFVTSVNGDLSVFHKQEIVPTAEAGKYDCLMDGMYFNTISVTSTNLLKYLFILRDGSTGTSNNIARVKLVKFSDSAYLIPVVKGNQIGFYNTIDGQMFLAEQACLSAGPRVI